MGLWASPGLGWPGSQGQSASLPDCILRQTGNRLVIDLPAECASIALRCVYGHVLRNMECKSKWTSVNSWRQGIDIGWIARQQALHFDPIIFNVSHSRRLR